MTIFRWLFIPVAVVALWIVIRQHADYLRRQRPFTFRAFLGTAGWLVMTLGAAAASLGSLESTGTQAVEVSVLAIGVLLVAVGSHVRPAPRS